MDVPKHVIDLPDAPLPGQLYKAADGSLVIGMVADPTVDESRMIASAVISTPTPDRDDDLVESEGVILVEYERNPVVLWEHGYRSVDTPIAKSKVDGKLAIHVFPDRIEADCQFTHRNKTSEQIFALIADGIVRATSVRINPIDAVVRPGREPDRMGLHIRKWSMPEWSWCMIGANPEAVAKTLESGKIGGSRIAPSLVKSLTRAVPASTSTTVRGSEMPKQTKAKSDPPPVEEEEKPEEEVSVEPKADEPVDDTAPAEETTGAQQPYGAQVLTAVHASLSDAIANIGSALGPMEQPEVKDYLGTLVTELEAKVAEVEGMYGSKYPDADPLAKGDDPDDEAMKSWLKSANGHRLQLAGYGNRLKMLAGAKNLKPEQRKVLDDTVKHLGRIEREGRTLVKSADQAAIDALQAKIDQLKQRLPA